MYVYYENIVYQVSNGRAPDGYLTSWHLFISSKSSMPGIYPGKMHYFPSSIQMYSHLCNNCIIVIII